MATAPSQGELKPDAFTRDNAEGDQEKGPAEIEYSPEELKRVIRKLDWYLMPLCFLLYTFSVLDVSYRHREGTKANMSRFSDRI